MAFESLADKLQNVFKNLRGKGRLTEADVKAALKEVKMALLEADVSFKVVKQFISSVQERAIGQDVLESLTPGQMVIKIVNEELVKLMGSETTEIALKPQNEITVIMMIGLQGAGKTTTMRIMAGLNQPDRGSITIAGTDAVKNSKKIKRIIGYMPDFFGVYDNLKVIEYMEFYASIYGITGSASEKLCQNLLELVDLADKSEFFVDELSRGMKQRLCLARCLVHDPKLLILDEPASGLDPRARLEIQDILKRLKDKKKTLIISSHILHDLTELCTSVGVIDQGKMLVKGKVDEIMLHLNASNPIHIHVTEGKQTAVNLLKADKKVSNISISDNDITIGFLGTIDDEAELLKQLVTNNVGVASFIRQSGNLEEIFMKVTEKREVLFNENKDKSGLW